MKTPRKRAPVREKPVACPICGTAALVSDADRFGLAMVVTP